MQRIIKIFKGIARFLRETKTELTKVTWPSKHEVMGSTIVTVVVSLILSLFIGVVDFILNQGIQSIF